MKKMFQKTVAMAALGLMVMAGTAQADILALYPFASNSRSSTDANLNSTATDFSDGLGFIGGTSFTTAGNPGPSIRVDATFTDGTTSAGAVNNNDYFFFTISPNNGFQLNLDSLTLDTSSSSTTTESFSIRSNRDNFATDLINFSRNTTTFLNSTVALTNNAAFQNLTSLTEFRFYVFDNSNPATVGSQFARLDNVTLNGTVTSVTAVPEPGTITLMLLGIVGAGSAARKRKKAEQEKAQSLTSA